jgi:flagellar basal body rod protein FlgC
MASTDPGHHGAVSNSMSISASGMQAASLRFSAAASNIVNRDPAAPPADPGGNAAPLPAGSPTSRLAYDPRAPYANLQGTNPQDVIAAPNSDSATEIVHLQEAANSFRANLLAFKASSQMFNTLLDVTA